MKQRQASQHRSVCETIGNPLNYTCNGHYWMYKRLHLKGSRYPQGRYVLFRWLSRIRERSLCALLTSWRSYFTLSMYGLVCQAVPNVRNTVNTIARTNNAIQYRVAKLNLSQIPQSCCGWVCGAIYRSFLGLGPHLGELPRITAKRDAALVLQSCFNIFRVWRSLASLGKARSSW